MKGIALEKPNVSAFHIIIAAMVTALIWVWTSTILLPFFICLKLSITLRKKFFTWVFCTLFTGMFPVIKPMRKKLFDLLPTDKKKLKVLEIGVGGGANFEFYPEGCEVTLLDMNENFHVEIQKTLEAYPNLKVEKTIFAMAEDMKGVGDSEYDLVICTHLLCSVKDQTAVLKEICRVLKKDGMFAYMEHVSFPKSHIAYWIQRAMSPLWRVYMNGCCLDRPSYKIINDYFFQNSYKVTYPPSLPLFFKPHAVGLATKPNK